MKSLTSAQHYPSRWNTQGQETIRPVLQTALKSNVFNFMSVPVISASLIKIQLKQKSLSSRHFPIICLTENKWHVDSPIWPKIELVQDLMAVLITASLIKGRSNFKSLSFGQHFPKSMNPSRAGNYPQTNDWKWAKIEMLCLSSLSAKLMKIQSKIKSLSSAQHFPH